ncbi:hypothetical protein Droror1_Dr00008713 [Drosera rotundifolia]
MEFTFNAAGPSWKPNEPNKHNKKQSPTGNSSPCFSHFHLHVKTALSRQGRSAAAQEDLEEYTAVYFRIFKDGDNYVVLRCSVHLHAKKNSTTRRRRHTVTKENAHRRIFHNEDTSAKIKISKSVENNNRNTSEYKEESRKNNTVISRPGNRLLPSPHPKPIHQQPSINRPSITKHYSHHQRTSIATTTLKPLSSLHHGRGATRIHNQPSSTATLHHML